ncbi:uncharacterized protein TNCV_76051 [Trichonephila clavipes]|nr:uncharacterized protein TNCV_76051 [Trichonephila clavipes]
MGKKGDFSLCKKAEVNSLVNAKLLSNREISRTLKVSEASVPRIKKKIESGEELSPKRKKKCGRKPIFPPRSERSFKKICLENRFSTTKVITSQLQDINVNASERTVRRKLQDLNFKTWRPTRKSKLTPATKAKRLNWAKHWRDKDVYFWKSVGCDGGPPFHKDYNSNLYTDPVVVYKQRNFWECLSPHRKRVTHFPRLEEGNVPINTSWYGMFLGISAFWVSYGPREDIPPLTSDQSEKLIVFRERIPSRIQGYDEARPVQDVLQNRFIPQLEEWFPNGEPYIFMQDGTPCHTAPFIKAVLAEQNIPLLDWPGNSPDMNQSKTFGS